MRMIDVQLPTSDGRTIILSRYTQPTLTFNSFSSSSNCNYRSVAAKNYCLGPTGRIGLCSEDLSVTYLDSERLPTDAPLESAKTG